jgi:hypothetical protein
MTIKKPITPQIQRRYGTSRSLLAYFLPCVLCHMDEGKPSAASSRGLDRFLRSPTS